MERDGEVFFIVVFDADGLAWETFRRRLQTRAIIVSPNPDDSGRDCRNSSRTTTRTISPRYSHLPQIANLHTVNLSLR